MKLAFALVAYFATAMFLVSVLSAQTIIDPHASLIDVPARQAALRSTTDPHLREAIGALRSCAAMPLVPAPTGPIEIPHHYLKGSFGPINPAEAVATRAYSAYERRITSGMNEFVATGSHAEAECALEQMDAWAKGGALLNYDPKTFSQSWYQAEWTLTSSGVTMSVLVNDAALDPVEVKRVTAWLNTGAHRLISFEKPGELGNNHHYFRALAAISIGVVSNDNTLFQFGVETYHQAISEIDTLGAFPREMARHDRAIHYQAFALQPLIPIAAFAERQHVDLYGYTEHGRTLRNAIVFFGRAVEDPSLVKTYTDDQQIVDFNGSDYAPFQFYVARFGIDGLPASVVNGVRENTVATRIGGNTTVLAGK
jgi:poly(beta-D-mannuronate) lyase